MRTAIYVRISMDRVGAGLGVERQEKECRDYCERRGWSVVDVYVDNDLTASKRNKIRPAFQKMIRDIEAGIIDAVVSWHIDRLTRQPRELEDVIDLHDDYGTQLGTVTGDIDLGTPSGRMMARVLGNAAKYESEHKADRQRSWHKQRAEAGRPHMGGPRPYGYLPDRISLDPNEAPHIADAATRVLAGESLRSVAMDMNARGIRTVTGKEWSAQLLSQVLRSARISGRREVFRKGQVHKGMGEIVAVDCWQPIITPEQSDRLRDMFANPGRRAPERTTRAGYLLTGILRCERCGSRMNALAWKAGNTYLYRCPPKGMASATPSCGRTSVQMKYAEPVVRNLVLELVGRGDFRDRLHAKAKVDPMLTETIRKDEEQLTDLATMMAEGALSMVEWKAARDVIQSRLDGNKRQLARSVNMSALALLDHGDGDLVDRFERLNLSQKRAVLGEVLDHVKVMPVGRSGKKVFDPKRLVPEFRV